MVHAGTCPTGEECPENVGYILLRVSGSSTSVLSLCLVFCWLLGGALTLRFRPRSWVRVSLLADVGFRLASAPAREVRLPVTRASFVGPVFLLFPEGRCHQAWRRAGHSSSST